MAFVPSISPLVLPDLRPALSSLRRTQIAVPHRPRARMSASAVDAVVGTALPATSVDGASLSLAAAGAGGKLVILYFYPKDCTPGCTVEAQDFRDAKPELEKLNAVVIGASRDSLASHEDFKNQQSLNFPLVSDEAGALSEAFGVWKERNMFGKTFMGIERSTFILKDGKIVKEWRGVKSSGHAAKVVEAVKEIAAA